MGSCGCDPSYCKIEKSRERLGGGRVDVNYELKIL